MSKYKLHAENGSTKKGTAKTAANKKNGITPNKVHGKAADKLSRRDLIVKLVFWLAVLVYGGLSIYLHYNQSVQPLDENNRYFQSDLPYHISMIVDDGWYYSLTAYAYMALYKLAGNTTVLIAILLAAASVATIVLTEKLLRKLGITDNIISSVGAFVLNLIMPFYVKWAGAYRYVSYQSANIWHNSTYQCMKPVALCCILLFLALKDKYKDKGIKVTEWILFSALLAVTTGIKPSFLTVFAPAFAIMLLFDLITRKTKFLRVLAFGTTVFPSFAVMLWQNSVLFGSDTKSGFKISFMESFSFHADHPKITVLLSLAFPIAVILSTAVQLIKDLASKKKTDYDENFVFGILMAAIGFMEAALLIETGPRWRDGNFLWGYSIAMFWLECLCYKKWFEMLEKKRWVRFAICGLVLAYQLYCGTLFLGRLLVGETYFLIY